MKNWYLIYTKPREERLAKENLERQGYSTYLPMVPGRRRYKGQLRRKIDPLFPRYLFIHLSDKTDNWGPIRSTVGVSALVYFGNIPAKIPAQLINQLRLRENSDGLQDITLRKYHKGDPVRIAEGPFEGFEGIFHCKSGKDRVVILLKIAEQGARVQLEQDQIEPL